MPTPTHIALLVDRSGSMASMWQETVAGVETFLDEQKALPGKHRFTLCFFDSGNVCDSAYANVKRAKATGVPDTITPRGLTPLRDAMGALITNIEKNLEEGWEVSMVVLTDGRENASQEYTHEQLKALVDKKKDEGWMFLFIGANIDVFEAGGGDYGTHTIQADGDSLRTGYATASKGVGARSLHGTLPDAHTDVRDK